MFSTFDREFLATYLRPQRPRLVLLSACLAATIGGQLANPALAGTFIDQAKAGAPFDRLLHLAIAFTAVAALTQVATVAETYVAEDIGWRTTNALRVDLTAHVLGLDDSFHAEHGAGELLERIDGDVGAIAGFFGRFVVHVVGSACFLLGVLGVLWWEDWRVGGLLTIFAAVALAFMLRGGSFVGARARVARQTSADLSEYLEERLSALPDIKANGADEDTMRGLHLRLAARFLHGRRSVFAGSLFGDTVSALFVAGAAAALAVGAWLERSGALTVGAVYMVFRYTGMLRLPLERLSRHMNSFQQATGGIVRVSELLATTPRVVEPAGGGVAVPSGALSVELDHVSFAYGGEPVLRDVTLRLEPGEVLGLLGRTGSGKTTISRLVFRLHDVDGGALRVGGVDVRDASLSRLRSRIGLVTQDVQLFAGTLRDNVALFDRTIDDTTVRGAFTALGLEPWLDDLPDGLDTELASTGRGLSAGEGQLVALARVFLKDPGLVVLDEASSRLDPHTERLLEGALSRLLDGRTGIVIAHRLATIERAETVVILEQGAVVEQGRRLELAGDPTSRLGRLLRAGTREVLA